MDIVLSKTKMFQLPESILTLETVDGLKETVSHLQVLHYATDHAVFLA